MLSADPAGKQIVHSLGIQERPGALFPRLFRRDDNFGPITQAAKKFFAVLPAKPEFGDVGEAESTDDITEKIDVGLVKISIHHCVVGPIYQFRLAQFAVQVFSNLIGNDLAGDFH